MYTMNLLVLKSTKIFIRSQCFHPFSAVLYVFRDNLLSSPLFQLEHEITVPSHNFPISPRILARPKICLPNQHYVFTSQIEPNTNFDRQFPSRKLGQEVGNCNEIGTKGIFLHISCYILDTTTTYLHTFHFNSKPCN